MWSDDLIVRMGQEVARERFAVLHASGLSAVDLMARTGLSRSAVYRRIERMGLAPGVSGPPRKDFCVRGHSLAEHGVEIPAGGRFCTACKRERQRLETVRCGALSTRTGERCRAEVSADLAYCSTHRRFRPADLPGGTVPLLLWREPRW